MINKVAAAEVNFSTLTSRNPEEVVAFCKDQHKTIADLERDASALAARFPDGGNTINLYSDRYNYLTGFCASMLAGHSTLMPPNRQSGTIEEIEGDYPGSYRIGCEIDKTQVSQPDADFSTKVDQPAIIAFTSGSTGKARATRKSWDTLRTSTDFNFEALLGDLPSNPVLVATVPCQHMWGFETSVLLPLLKSTAISYQNPLFAPDIVAALNSVPGPVVLVSSPLHLRTLMRSGLQTPAIARICTATAPLDAEEALEFESYFKTEVLDVFGCTESGIIATRRTAHEKNWQLGGLFQLKSAESCTEIHADHLPEPVILPDHVELLDDHTFRWIGRHHDMINIAGKRGSLSDLNTRLIRISGVEDGVIFQPKDATRLAAMVVAPGLDSKQILNELKSQIEPAFLPRPLVKVGALPRQETGKLSESAVLDFFEKNRGRKSPESGL